MKNFLSLGRALNKTEQRMINGGTGNCTPQTPEFCSPDLADPDDKTKE
ncbi:hypothetical protein [Flavivirga jejuensis]|uniref:Bacteriocin-like protein n=1 Tax=Flavivirga jejuensis TaxID=870487 RepID=A0ABT8WKA6_9FLAO|nr:hypothetical protein [Flavivirga jejuensis]MDO5973495.1 hypothetical protein [Flavivirga jejuensis]